MKPMDKKQESFIASLMPDSDKKMVRIASASLVVALMLGFWASTYEAIIGDVIFEPASPPEINTHVTMLEPETKTPPKPKYDKNTKTTPGRKSGGGGKPKGDGDPREPLKRGMLGILTSQKPSSTAEAYTLFNHKFASDIDKIIKNTNGLQVTPTTNIGGRRGKPGSKYNEGSFGGGSGGIKGSLTGLLGGPAGPIGNRAMKGNIKTPKPNEIDMGSSGASRSASDIMKIVKQRTPGLRHIYNKHLKKVPGFDGKVTLKFTIAPGGEIISISLVSSTTGNSAFDKDIKDAISRWTFGAIKSGNTTVTIPFTFTE